MSSVTTGETQVADLIGAMTEKTGPLSDSRAWSVVREWDSFSAHFVLIESGEDRIALKLGTNWNAERVRFVADETRRVRELLMQLPGGGVTMPDVFGTITDPPALAISFVKGDLLFDSLPGLDDDAISALLAKCGRAIGAYHNAQPATAVGSPDPFSKRDLSRFARYLKLGDARATAMASRLHSARRYQFSANDLLIDESGNVVLLDPPHFSRYDFIHRDLATVNVELHRRFVGARRPGKGDSWAKVVLARAAFVRGYQETGPSLQGEDDQMAIALFEISRVLGIARNRFRVGRLISGFRALNWARWIRGETSRRS